MSGTRPWILKLIGATVTVGVGCFASQEPLRTSHAPDCRVQYAYSWDSPAPQPTGHVRAVPCEGLLIEAERDELLLTVDGHVEISIVALDALAIRDPQGVAYVTVNMEGEYHLHLPWRDAVVYLDSIAEHATLPAIWDVVAAPDGWWVWIRLSGPSDIALVYVSRATLIVERVRWPSFLQPTELRITPRLGGLDVIVEDDPELALRFRIQRQSSCRAPEAGRLEMRARCRTRAARGRIDWMRIVE